MCLVVDIGNMLVGKVLYGEDIFLFSFYFLGFRRFEFYISILIGLGLRGFRLLFKIFLFREEFRFLVN